MVNSFTYEGTLNVTGDIRVNGRQVYTEAPKKYDMNGKIVTHRAIPIHTVRPGYRYCFPDGHIYIRGVEDADLQDESFKRLWRNKLNYDRHATAKGIRTAFESSEVRYVYSIVVYIPKNFDAHAFLTDSAYVESLCFRTPNGVLETTSPNFEIHNGKNKCVAMPVITNSSLLDGTENPFTYKLRGVFQHQTGARKGKSRTRKYVFRMSPVKIWNNFGYNLMRCVFRRMRRFDGPKIPVARIYKSYQNGVEECKLYIHKRFVD